MPWFKPWYAKTRTLPQDKLYMPKKYRNVAFYWYRSLLCAFVCLWAFTVWKYPFFITYRRQIANKERFLATFKFIFWIEYCPDYEKRHHVCLVRYIRASLEQNFQIFKNNFFLRIDHCVIGFHLNQSRWSRKHWITEENTCVLHPYFLIRYTLRITKMPIWKYFIHVLARKFDFSKLCTFITDTFIAVSTKQYGIQMKTTHQFVS